MRNRRLCIVLAVAVWALAGCQANDIVDADQSGAQRESSVQSSRQAVAFHATYDNTFELAPPFPPPIVNGILQGVGESVPFGKFVHDATGQIDITVIPWGLTATGSFTYRDGSELHYTCAGTSIEDPPGSATFSGSFTVTGGTGRFTNATGGGDFAGNSDLVAGVDHWEFDGTISYFGGVGRPQQEGAE